MNSVAGILLRNLAFSRRMMLVSVHDLSAAELARSPYPAGRSCARLLAMTTSACRRAWGDFSLAEVTAHAGCSDQSQFPDHFKRLLGVTTGQFRTRIRIA